MLRSFMLSTLLILSTNCRDITTSLKDTPATGIGKSLDKEQENITGVPSAKEFNTKNVIKPETGSAPDQTVTSSPAVHLSKTPINATRSGFGYDSNFNSGWFFDSSSVFNSGYTGFGNTLHSTVSCPEPNNPSTPFIIGTDGTGYPVVLIGAELTARPAFAAVLVQEVPGTIVVPADTIFDTANRTCPGVALNVWTFLSATRGACWVLQGFQDPLFTVTCQVGDCVGCSSYSTSSSSYVGTSTVYKKRCIPQYQSISVWAFCPLVVFPAIVREQVIVPSFCSCVQAPCTKTTTGSYK